MWAVFHFRPVLDIHAGGGAHTREGEHHEADESAVTEPDDGRCIDGIEELPCLLGRQDRRLALFGGGTADRGRMRRD